MKKLYKSPVLDVINVELVDCLAVSQSVLPEVPIPDVTAPGGGGDEFEW